MKTIIKVEIGVQQKSLAIFKKILWKKTRNDKKRDIKKTLITVINYGRLSR